jgi:hypothetical protein
MALDLLQAGTLGNPISISFRSLVYKAQSWEAIALRYFAIFDLDFVAIAISSVATNFFRSIPIARQNVRSSITINPPLPTLTLGDKRLGLPDLPCELHLRKASTFDLEKNLVAGRVDRLFHCVTGAVALLAVIVAYPRYRSARERADRKQHIAAALAKDAAFTETLLKMEFESPGVTYKTFSEFSKKSIEQRNALIVDMRVQTIVLKPTTAAAILDFLNAENVLCERRALSSLHRWDWT